MQDSDHKPADVITLSLPAVYSQGGFVQVRTVVVPVRQGCETGPLPLAPEPSDALTPPPGRAA
jgi:hypothetical protein